MSSCLAACSKISFSSDSEGSAVRFRLFLETSESILVDVANQNIRHCDPPHLVKRWFDIIMISHANTVVKLDFAAPFRTVVILWVHDEPLRGMIPGRGQFPSPD